MKKISFLFLALFVFTFSNAQTGISNASLKSDAKKMGELFFAKDYNTYVKYINPKISKLMGGDAKLIATLKSVLTEMGTQGFTIKSVIMGEPSSIIQAGSEYQSVVPQNITLKSNDGTLVTTSYLIAISTNMGRTWTFADTSGKSLAEMQKFFPSLSNKLIIPKKTEPTFIKN
jgi:hypothetical protein